MSPRKAAPSAPSIRDGYVQHGVAAFYAQSGHSYRNPHEDGVREAVLSFIPELPPGRILDLACGSGEVTLALREGGIDPDSIDGCDPYTAQAYRERTGRDAQPSSFQDIASGIHKRYGTVICSFALHLCEPSWLPLVVQSIARASRALLVLTPHKRPSLRPEWGMSLLQERCVAEPRVRARLYLSDRCEFST